MIPSEWSQCPIISWGSHSRQNKISSYKSRLCRQVIQVAFSVRGYIDDGCLSPPWQRPTCRGSSSRPSFSRWSTNNEWQIILLISPSQSAQLLHCLRIWFIFQTLSDTSFARKMRSLLVFGACMVSSTLAQFNSTNKVLPACAVSQPLPIFFKY
jgi:hypothetical protein